MNTKALMISLVALLLVALLAAPGFAGNGKGPKDPVLAAPGNVSCTIDTAGETVDVTWDPVTGADKYATCFECTYELEGEPGIFVEVECEVDYDEGEMDCGGTPCDNTDTTVSVDFSVFAYYCGVDPSDTDTYTCVAKVKGLDPGPDYRQNNPHGTDVCEVPAG